MDDPDRQVLALLAEHLAPLFRDDTSGSLPRIDHGLTNVEHPQPFPFIGGVPGRPLNLVANAEKW